MNCLLCRSCDVQLVGKRSQFFRQIDAYQDFLDVPVASFDRQIARCGVCGFQYIHPMYTAEDLGQLYSGAGYRRFMGVIHPKLGEEQLGAWERDFIALGALDLVVRTGTAKPRFLDIGCGMGRNMIVFDRLGFDVHGLDMNEEETAYVRNELKFQVYDEDLEAFTKRGASYDCVLASHFIEHVQDPHRFFEMVMPLVSPGGMLVIETPLVSDFSGRHTERYKDIYHTLFFDHFTLALAGAIHGFTANITRNVLYFEDNGAFNLNIQVRYERAEEAPNPARDIGGRDGGQLRLARKAYDAITSEAIVWARSYQNGFQAFAATRLALQIERRLARLRHQAGRIPLRIRRILRHSEG